MRVQIFRFGTTGVVRACMVSTGGNASRSASALSGKLLLRDDDQRRRLANHLDNDTAQSLVALSINLAALKDSPEIIDPRLRQALAESMILADKCLSDLRSISDTLHPRELDGLDLTAALAAYIYSFARRTGIQVYLDVPVDVDRLSRNVETALFRIAQEALDNVHRHSRSESASIHLIRHSSAIMLEVKDAGIGVPDDVLPGVGIASMWSRLKDLNGSMEIVSEHGVTTVSAMIPVA